MQVSAPDREISGKISEDFEVKLKVSAPDRQKQEEENEEDFSFACTTPDGSPIAADAIFQNGQIRPTFPIFDQTLLYDNVNGDSDGERSKNSSSSSVRPPVRKFFVEERSKQEEPAGPFCAWTSGKPVKEVSPETCKKSNSTGFSKLWRFREFVLRSNSDGKDAFVFLNNNNNNGENIGNSEKHEKSSTCGKTTTEKTNKNEKTTTEKTSKSDKVGKVKITGEKKAKTETVSSAYERHYVKNREMKDGDKRKTYSPYRPELVGFFTNVNGMSRNVHPF